MPDDADAVELAELEIARLVDICHNQRLNYWEILRIFLNTCQNLIIQADIEFHLKQG